MIKARTLTGLIGSSAVAAALMVTAAQPAQAATGNISVTFNDWRCTATGGGSVVAVQMGSEYGSAPYTSGKTITISARTGTANHLTGTVWCKRPWYRGGITTPVYNISQGLWVDSVGQHFNV